MKFRLQHTGLKLDQLRSVFTDVIFLNPKFLHPAAYDKRLKVSVEVAPYPGWGRPQTDLRSDRLVKSPVAPALTVMSHLADVTFHQPGVSIQAEHFFSRLDTGVAREHDAFSAEFHAEDEG